MGLTIPSKGSISPSDDMRNKFMFSINGVTASAVDLSIESREDAEYALDLACRAIDLADDIKAIKDSLTAPSKQFISEVNDAAEIYTNRLLDVKKTVIEQIEWWKLGTSEVGELRTSNIMAYDKSDFVFQVTDLEAIPKEYLVVDEKKIKEAMKGGVASIPGLQIVKTTKTILKRV